jgi:hypothetical protein
MKTNLIVSLFIYYIFYKSEIISVVIATMYLIILEPNIMNYYFLFFVYLLGERVRENFLAQIQHNTTKLKRKKYGNNKNSKIKNYYLSALNFFLC